MLAIDIEAAKKIGLVLMIGFALFAVVSAVVVKAIVTKLILVVILGGLALGVWTQRTNVQDCADKVRSSASTGGGAATSCKFFGAEVKVPQVTVPAPAPSG